VEKDKKSRRSELKRSQSSQLEKRNGLGRRRKKRKPHLPSNPKSGKDAELLLRGREGLRMYLSFLLTRAGGEDIYAQGGGG